MKIVEKKCYFFSLKTTQSLHVNHASIDHRQGFVIELTDEHGNTGIGEISPLPGLDHETLEEVKAQLSSFFMMVSEILPEHFSLTSRFFNLISNTSIYCPSVMAGIESALLMLCIKNRIPPFEKFIDKKNIFKVAINGLFIPALEGQGSAAQIDSIISKGFSTIKVKIGRMSPEVECEQILKLCSSTEHRLKLRLDGNCQLTMEQYQGYYNKLKGCPIEYVEEPLLAGNFDEAGRVGWSLAIDESMGLFLDEKRPENLISDIKALPQAVSTMILKPAGLSQLMELVSCLHQEGIKPVLSSAYNAAIILTNLLLIPHLTTIDMDIAHGLDTGKYLREDILINPPKVEQGCLIINSSFFDNTPALNYSVLSQVSL